MIPVLLMPLIVVAAGPLKNAQEPLVIPTYEGSGQLVHPDIFFFPEGWNEWEYWMAFTPYPFEKGKYENPSIAASHDGLLWQVPDGLVNPIDSTTHYVNCDPDLSYNSLTKELLLYYVDRGLKESFLKISVSKNGKEWSIPKEILTTSNFFVSPAVVSVKDKGGKENFLMWSIRTNGWAATSSIIEFRESSDGFIWCEPETLTIDMPGKVLWHMDVDYIHDFQEFWSLLCCYDSMSIYDFPPPVWIESDSVKSEKNIPTELYLARSKDGKNWKFYSKPALIPPRDGWDSERIYRSTFLYDSLDARIRIWYSASNRKKVWHVSYTECNLKELANYLGWAIDSLEEKEH